MYNIFVKAQIKANEILTLQDGRTLGFAEYGDLQGKPVFFFHGWPSSRLQAHILDKPAKKLHLRIIAIDRPGYGLSDFAPKRKLLDWADDVLALADALRIKKFSVLGVSGGGPYAAVCAYKIPQKLNQTTIVAGLGPTDKKELFQGMVFFNQLAWRSYHTFPLLRKLFTAASFLQAKNILPESFNSPLLAKADKEILRSKTVQKDIARNRAEAFRQGTRACEMDLKLYASNWKFDLKKITGNVILFYGDDDKNVSPMMGKYYASQIRKSKLIIYPNEGHFIIRSHAEEILKTFT